MINRVLSKRGVVRKLFIFFLTVVLSVGWILQIWITTNFHSYKLPVDSMSPVLKKGDRVFVDLRAYKHTNPNRGDLAVFLDPLGSGNNFVKRVVGLPGEMLEIRDGKIFINENIVDTQEIPITRIYANRGDYGKKGQVVNIPKDSYYVLGDKSERSADSRFWGFVPRSHFRGKTVFVYWPLNRWSKTK